jgi:ABC transporter DrrB family efflux protein
MSTRAVIDGVMPTQAGVAVPPPAARRRNPIGDSWVVARRALLHMRRQPEALADVTIQPIMFVLLFAYVFGGAIQVSDGGYREFLMGGIFAQTIVFGAFGVAIALAYDRSNGAIDRFRSLPMARGAVLGGQAVASLVRATLPIVLMSICGLIVGWRIHTSVLEAVGGYALMIAFSFAVIWIGVLMGSLLPTPEAVQGVAFVVIFPVTFIASTFVPVDTLPNVLRQIAEWNPVTSFAEALREMFGNPTGDFGPGAPWSLQHPALYTLLWIGAIVLICAPLAIRAYQRTVSD